ncbi:MAG: UDP-2,3-diacylglucosamine diphosphatase [Campylobacteraceae bacterium]|jgi:UDP-2,3-diacylglucosamine hydrolase|nr:UDP-2,3-diacylglucosamine diphosphatase [Campylobacteraceae bacterium]
MSLEIKDGALFVADAHENGKNRTLFAKFLDKIKTGETAAAQLFLMGDMFDLLVGGAKKTEYLFKNEIAVIEEIGQKIEVFYFEGNHDFNLGRLFSNAKVIPLKKQPILFESRCGLFNISHGDLNGEFGYKLYTALIRNPFLIAVLNLFDRYGLISNSILKKLEKKELCVKIDDFEQIALNKTAFYQNCDFIVEGHYHQNQSFVSDNRTYINLGSFACGGKFYRFDSKSKPHFKEFTYKES